MKEAISELRATIRRLSPQLLVPPSPEPLPCPPTTNGDVTHSSQGASNSIAIQNELQVDATKELVNAISSFLWTLDMFWHECSLVAEEGDEEKTSKDANDTHGRKAFGSRSSQEPYTEWNDEAKSLIREGYGLLVTISSPSFVKNDCHVYRDHHQQHEELRIIVRTSILELLTSVNTSASRHFLLEFLPHFIPLSILAQKGIVIHDEDQFWSAPSWLEQNDEAHFLCSDSKSPAVGAHDSETTTLVQTAVEQFMDTFRSLIQIDPSTLAPFLATMSLLLENHPDPTDTDSDLVLEQTDTLESHSDSPSTSVRKKCCHLCISSLPSVSVHDLPSIVHSLFTLVCDEEDGHLAVQAIRKEWMSISNSRPEDDSILYIGSVIILSLLSDEMIGSKHIALGFLDEVTESLSRHLESFHETKNEAGTCRERSANSKFISTLDALVITALYSQHAYQQMIESILDSLISRQSFLVFDLILPLIRIWQSGYHNERSYIGSCKKDHANLLLYEPLASPLISLLFYLIIATSSSEMTCGCRDFVRVGGILPFLSKEEASLAASNKIHELSFACCEAFAELYSVVDFQRREQIINSLLSMISDSYVESVAVSNRTSKSKMSAAAPSLIATSYSACCALLLLSVNHLEDLAQTRSIVLDRLLLLASLSHSTTLISEEKDDVTYMLFDMNSALLISLMQGYTDRDATNRNGASELLIVYQKLLFSSMATLDDGNDDQHRVVCGIILASRLLRCHKISRLERKDVWNSVVKILSPSIQSSTAPSRKLNPEIGTWGLAFLRFASSKLLSVADSKPSGYVSQIPQFVETSSVCGEKDMFSIVNNMLAAAGVIQMENSLKISSLSSSGAPITFLAYNEVPVHYSKEAPSPRFVVCAPYFLSGISGNDDQSQSLLSDEKRQMPVSVRITSNYLYDLVDCYLQLGKCRKQGWNPIGWLLAKIQLPCCLPGSIIDALDMKKCHQLELDIAADFFSPFTASLGANESPWKRVATEILRQKKSRAAIVQRLIEFLNCIVISISVSCVVLKHADEHFRRQSTLLPFATNSNIEMPSKPSRSECNEQNQQKKRKKRLRALRKLIQFQFVKIQHMHRICERILFALKCIYAEVCRICHGLKRSTQEFKTNSRELNAPILRISLSRLKYTIAAFESTMKSRFNGASFSSLWNCLLDDEDDNFLNEFIRISATSSKANPPKISISSNEKVHHIILLRAGILQQLQHHFRRISVDSVHFFSREGLDFLFEESLQGISRVFSNMISLSSCIQNLKDVGLDRQSLLSFVYFHYNLLLTAFSSYTQDLHLKLSLLNDYVIVPKQRRKLIVEHLPNNCSLYLSSLLRACAATISKDGECVSAPLAIMSKILKDQLIQQFEQCENSATACQIIDLLSALIIHIDIDEASSALAELSRKALNTVYSTNGVEVGPPNALFKIWHSLTRTEIRDTEFDHVLIVQDSFSSLIQTANSLHKKKDSSICAFMHNVLTHWSALVLCGSSQHAFLVELCESIGVVIATSGKRDSMRFKRASKNVHFVGLNEKSCIPTFELLIQMVITSLSLSRPIRIRRKRGGGTTIQPEHGPYQNVMQAFVAFDRLLRLFQDCHFFFPERLFFSINRATLHVVKLSIHQLHMCVEWRNSQPLSLENLNGDDPAGAYILRPLIDAIGCNCIGSIESFCDSFKRSAAANNMSDTRNGLSCKHSKAIAGLLFKCDGARDILQNISRTQKVGMTSKFFMQSHYEMLHNKTLQQEATKSKNNRRSKRSIDHPNRSTKRQRYDTSCHPSTVLENLRTAFKTSSAPSSDSSIGDLTDNQDTRFDDDGSFGAVGDWG